MVGPGRVERPTSRLSGVRSNHLSYEPGSCHATAHRYRPCARSTERRKRNEGGGSNEPLSIDRRETDVSRLSGQILRKEVIQPQVPLRLPCYDFGPVADPTVAGCLLAVSAPSSGKTNSHAVTGGVYKTRERIHRSLLFCDY